MPVTVFQDRQGNLGGVAAAQGDYPVRAPEVALERVAERNGEGAIAPGVGLEGL